ERPEPRFIQRSRPKAGAKLAMTAVVLRARHISSPLPRSENLDSVAILDWRRLSRPRWHELAVEGSRDRRLGIFERRQGLRERGGGDLPRLAVDDDFHVHACSIAARAPAR